MGEIAAWIAPAATMIAAMMVAGNFNTRVTGWGFVVYTIGAIAWCVQGVVTGQHNLLWANGFLLLVDIVGIYRWLFRRARLDEGARKAVEESRASDRPMLFPVSRFAEAVLRGPGGQPVGRIVDAMAECGSGRISYIMLSEGGAGGIGERFHPLAWEKLHPTEDGFATPLSPHDVERLPIADPKDWPTAPSLR